MRMRAVIDLAGEVEAERAHVRALDVTEQRRVTVVIGVAAVAVRGVVLLDGAGGRIDDPEPVLAGEQRQIDDDELRRLRNAHLVDVEVEDRVLEQTARNDVGRIDEVVAMDDLRALELRQ
jgi:hypothetical protein